MANVVRLIHWILLTDVMGSGGGAFWGELDGENRGLKLTFVNLKHAQRAVPIIAREDIARCPRERTRSVQTSNHCVVLGLLVSRAMGNKCSTVSLPLSFTIIPVQTRTWHLEL